MEKLALVLGGMGDQALTAFMVYQAFQTIQWLVFFGLCTWGIRAVWKRVKKQEFGED
jgi:hypothetical protein